MKGCDIDKQEPVFVQGGHLVADVPEYLGTLFILTLHTNSKCPGASGCT
jgi:hypothetical protein